MGRSLSGGDDRGVDLARAQGGQLRADAARRALVTWFGEMPTLSRKISMARQRKIDRTQRRHPVGAFQHETARHAFDDDRRGRRAVRVQGRTNLGRCALGRGRRTAKSHELVSPVRGDHDKLGLSLCLFQASVSGIFAVE
jgi:hypothetical protein